MAAGSFTFVLHSHIPYVRNAGSWPFGEDILHEAIAETYLPLLNALHDLKAEGIEPRLTIGLTPILVEQIGDRDVLDHFEVYLDEKASAARRDEERFEREGDETFAGLARFYADYYGGIHQSLRHRYDRDVVGGFRRLQDAGNLDIITSAATHAYLPLLERDSSIYGQLKTGVESYRRAFGRAPHGVWLPECAYRPAYWKEDGRPYYKPGIEELLAGFNLRYFFTDTHVLEGGRLVGIAVGDAVGPYGLVRRRFVQRPEPQPAPTERTTLRPYYVQSTQVAVFGRDAPTGLQVWSAAHGYPGDFGYREFHRRDPESGLQYWRVTDASGDLGRKEPWNPERAYGQVAAHADHFVGLVARRLQEYAADHPTPGVVVSAYDTELFGHWWF
ncbi:MAG: 1,4-alpha-glucan branching protein, partial [Chloroflexi bacterium]|nr:1,4-alpha-glucan branching protein [Chloroflexota bacterium]